MTNSATRSFSFVANQLDCRSLLKSVIEDRQDGIAVEEIARAFHNSLAQSLSEAVLKLATIHDVDTVALSGGVFQNELLLGLLKVQLDASSLTV